MNEQNARELGLALREDGLGDFGLLELSEDQMEEGEYSLHFHTGGHSLPAEAVYTLANYDLGVSCLGERSDKRRYLWVLES